MSLLHLFRIQCKNIAWLSKEPPEELEPTPSPSVVLHRRIPSAHVAPSRPRATVTKSRLFTRAVNQAVTVCGLCVFIVIATITRCLLWFCFVSVIVTLSVPFAFCLCRRGARQCAHFFFGAFCISSLQSQPSVGNQHCNTFYPMLLTT